MFAFCVNEAGRILAKGPEDKKLVARYLMEDLQGDLEQCTELSRILQAEIIPNGSWSLTGNAHTITVTEEKVAIENEYDDSIEACVLQREEMVEVLREWMDFLQDGKSHPVSARDVRMKS